MSGFAHAAKHLLDGRRLRGSRLGFAMSHGPGTGLLRDQVMSNDATIGTPVTSLVGDLEVTVAPGQAPARPAKAKRASCGAWCRSMVRRVSHSDQADPRVAGASDRRPGVSHRATWGKKSGRADVAVRPGKHVAADLGGRGDVVAGRASRYGIERRATSVTQAWPSLSPVFAEP